MLRGIAATFAVIGLLLFLQWLGKPSDIPSDWRM